MNKKLMVIGIAAALAAPLAAQAGVEVYGQARASVDFNSNNDSTVGNKKDNISVSSNASRIGFKGDEDLGGGLALMWQIENNVDFDTGVAFNSPRPTFVGVGGDFGTVLAGKLDLPYKGTDKYDIFIDTKADYNGIMGNVGGASAFYDARTNNTLEYMLPNMNGFQAKLALVMADAISGNDNLPMSSAAEKRSAYDVGVSYDNGPLSLIADYLDFNKGITVGGSDKNLTAWKVGGAYTIMDATTVALIYESADALNSSGNVKARNGWYLSAKHKIGNTTLKLAYAGADKVSGNTTDNGADQISVGASQALTKNTEVYALYSVLNNKNGGAYGMAYGPANAVVGKDESVFSVGINHMFSSK